MLERVFSGSSVFSSVLLSLALALVIWMAATSQQLTRLTYPSTVASQGLPIELENLRDGLLVTSGDNQRVLVELLIARENESELTTSDVRAVADLSGLGAGTHQVEVQIVPEPFAPRFKMLNLRPNRILVQLDELVSREVPVTVELTDLAMVPANYRVLTPTVEPPTITIEGPKLVLDTVTVARAELSVNGGRATITNEPVLPQLLTADGPINPARLSAPLAEVLVTVPVERRQGFRELIVHPVLEGEPAVGYWVSRFSVDPEIVTVLGQPAVVDALDSIVDTQPISVQDLGEGEFIRNVPLELPDDVSPLAEGFVQVRIRIEPQTYSRLITLRPEIIGLSPGLAVTDTAIIPSVLDVLLKGPLIELDDLTPDDVPAALDVTDLEAGTHLLRPRITPPGSLRVESILPEQIEVTIEEQRATKILPVPISAINQSDGTVVVISPQTFSVTLEGPLLEIDLATPADVVATVDAGRRRTGTLVLTPTISVGGRMTVTDWLPPQVSLSIYTEQELLVLTRDIAIVGQAEGLQATLDTTVVIVRVAGPGTAATLRADPLFRVEVDLTGLGAGGHRVTPTVTLPPGYTLVTVVPRLVTVQLE